MEAPLIASSASRWSAAHDPRLHLVRSVAAATTLLLLALACLLVVRRQYGALLQPLPPAAFVTVGALLVAVVNLLRFLWRWEPSAEGRRGATLAALLLPGTALALLSYALSLPGTSQWALILVWAVIALQESAWWLAALRTLLKTRDRRLTVRQTTGEKRPLLGAGAFFQTAVAIGRLFSFRSAADQSETPPPAPADVESDLPAEVFQQITRAWQDGREVLFGRLRCRFAPAARNETLHVGFCPPLAAVPELSVHQIDGPPATVKTTQVETFGARLDVRLAATARQATDVVIEFYARQQGDRDKGTEVRD